MRTKVSLVILGLAFGVAALGVRAQEAALSLDKVPRAVMESVKKRFPKGEIKEASKEGEGDKLVYEVSVKLDGKNIDVTLTPAGAITLMEKEVAAGAVPAAVKATVEKANPGLAYQLIEEVIKVEGGRETLEYYEFHGTKDGKEVEVEVLPDGKLKK